MPLKVWLDTSPLRQGHAIRGIGQYTRQLAAALSELPDVEVLDSRQSDQAAAADLIHYPYFDLFAPTLPWQHSKPSIVTIHDVIPLKFPRYYRPGFKGQVKFWRQWWALRNVSAVITDSRSSWQDIHQLLQIPERKITVTHLGVNPDLARPTANEITTVRTKYRLPKHYLLYVGDINYNKNLPQLMKALKYLPPLIKLVCIGKQFYPHDIPEWRWIEAQMAMSGVTHRVKFITDLAADQTADLASVYAGALIYVQPSLYEGFGLPVVEAMRCGAPVVCPRTSSLIEVGGEHVTFTDTEAESMAEGINQVLNWSQHRRAQKIKAALEWSQQFTWAETARQTLTVYQRVVSGDIR